MATTQEEAVVRLGMDTSGLEAGEAKAVSFMDKFGKKLGNKIDKTLMGIFGLNLVSVVKQQLEHLVDYASKEIAGLVFGLDKQQREGKDLDKRRKMLHELVAENQKRMKDEAVIAKKDEEERSKALLKLGDLERKQSEDKMTDAEKIEDLQYRIMVLKKLTSDEDEMYAADRQTDLANDLLRLKQHEIALDALMQKRINSEKKVTEAKRERLAPILERPENKAALSAISALESDALMARRWGNMGRSQIDLQQAAGLRRQLIQRLGNEMNPQDTPMDRVAKSILDVIAPLKAEGGGVPVVVKNLD